MQPGTRLGPYEIVSRIGAGGMGEVWRARDTRLDREVAIKILPSAFAEDATLKIRFEREAKIISHLTHPNICSLFDVGDNYLVMELIEGESLAKRLQRGAMPLPEVLRYGTQIAEALHEGHKSGVIHRDVKPGNIMITKSGAKLLDFGLARSTTVPRESTPEQSTFQQEFVTTGGVILGTPQYMAPEQLGGEELDARADIFALGTVLYEMATGKRAFQGSSTASLIAAIVGSQPQPIRELQPLTPPALEHVILKCLEKDRDDRWQSASDIAEELRWISQAGSQAELPAGVANKRHRETILAVIAVLLAISVVVLTTFYVRANARAARVRVVDLTPPAGTTFNNVSDMAGAPMISPDGRYVVFSAAESVVRRLWLRDLETGEMRALSGTETATFPFWSPDSRNIGFFTSGSVKRVDINGGAPIVVAPTHGVGARGGAWSKEGFIVYAPDILGTLVRVPERGGNPVEITKMDRALHSSHRWPAFMPDGKHVLFLAANHKDPTSGSNGVYMVSIDGSGQRLVLNTPGNAAYSSGHLLFVRDTTLYAQKMSDDGKLSGDPWAVAADVLNDRGIWRGGFSASGSGDLVYCAGQSALSTQVLWVDRNGRETGTVADRDVYWDVRLSPDGKKLALGIGDPLRQIWIEDLTHKRRTRLDFGAQLVFLPTWSPDGSTIVALAVRENRMAVVAKKLDGSAARVLFTGSGEADVSTGGAAVSSDGKSVVYASAGSLWRIPLDVSAPAVKFSDEITDVSDPQFSPDGKWLAYVARRNGRFEVFVALSRDPAQHWQVSDNGGIQPHWRADGREFYYIDGIGVTAVEISTRGESLSLGNPQPLFPIENRGSVPTARVYDVSADGQRFIFSRRQEPPGVGVKLMTNWPRKNRR